MKRAMTLLLAAGMLMGTATASQAVDVKVAGNWQFGFEWAKDSLTKNNTKDTFGALQRFRTQVDFIASESLKGLVFFEIGKTDWGRGAGGGVGSDAYDVKVRYSYVDWMVPQTDLKVRMGIQPFVLPNFVAGENVLGTDAAGLTLSYQFNDMVGASLFWMRASNDNGTGSFTPSVQNSSADFFGLTVPVKGDGFKVTPWAMMGSVGNNSLNDINPAIPQDMPYMVQGLLPYGGTSATLNKSNDAYNTPWWLGIGGELTMFNPFRIAAEFRYGQADFGNVTTTDMAKNVVVGNNTIHNTYFADRNNNKYDLDRAGWYAGLIAEYKLDFMTPGLIFWYTSGDDGNPYNGSERMPYATENSNGGWTATNFGFDGQSDYGVSRRYDIVGQTNIGTWGVIAQLKDITFLEDLKHTLKLGYYQGTNNKNMPARAGMTGFRSNYDGLYMTTKDNAWEIDFVTNYQIYKELAVSFDLAYVRLDMDKSVWEPALGTAGWDNRNKNTYRIGTYMKYTF